MISLPPLSSPARTFPAGAAPTPGTLHRQQIDFSFCLEQFRLKQGEKRGQTLIKTRSNLCRKGAFRDQSLSCHAQLCPAERTVLSSLGMETPELRGLSPRENRWFVLGRSSNCPLEEIAPCQPLGRCHRRGEVWGGLGWAQAGSGAEFPEHRDPEDTWWGLVGRDREKFRGISARWVHGMGCSVSGMGPSWGHGIPWEPVPAVPLCL